MRDDINRPEGRDATANIREGDAYTQRPWGGHALATVRGQSSSETCAGTLTGDRTRLWREQP